MSEDFEVIEDLMLDGLKIVQDKRYYRFTSDSILLSRFASSKKNEVVGDFCSGSGIVSLNYFGLHRENVKSVTQFELQKELINLSKKTIKINHLEDIFCIKEGRLQDAGGEFGNKFSLILCNPPYKKANSGERSLTKHLAICRHECEITLFEIISCASRMLMQGGRFCICQRIERLTDLLVALCECKLEPCNLVMVSTKQGEPYLVIVESVKGKSPQLKVRNQIVNGD